MKVVNYFYNYLTDRTWFNFRCGTFISVCGHLLRSTQPGHPFVGRRNEYLRLGGG